MQNYTITYHANDDSYQDTSYLPDPLTIHEGQLVKLSTYLPRRICFQFTCWNTRADGLGTTYFPGELLPGICDDLILFAQWEEN